MDLRIGTAGYSYPDWVGAFYPRGMTAHDLLPFYARHFPAVEVNSSFYRPPPLDQIDKMARRTPAGFGFTLKVPRTVSHDRDPADLPAFKAAADRMAALGKLLGLMVQVPEAFHNSAANRDWLKQIADGLRPHTLAVEFRHHSWATPALVEWAAAAAVDVVSVGVPDLPTLFPSGPRVANRRVYARLHSQNADNWYKGGEDRYDYDYPEPVIRKWATALKAVADAGRADSGVFFFTNCVNTQAVANARTLSAVLKATAPSIRVIDPPTPEEHQPGLFD
ncbi:MAG: hypothetical protein JWO38_2380 [Gemmataceae bacterium]|nr:hypothetical protein [Gemmataceae bacterium]